MTVVLVGGRYRLGQRIGVGGMGRVWLARDEVLHRDVAIKEVLLPETPSEDEAYELRQRTLREARAAARLSHPNVVRVYDVMYADDRPWIVMEYIPSRSLAQIIKSDGPMPPGAVASVGLNILEALVAAHRAGVLHRDIKPGNVLLAEDGRVVLTDFGLATFDEVGSALTQSGVVHGSPQFIAPERALDGTSTAESDMWSLGATLFAAVEGQSPYARPTSYQTLAALATAPPDTPKRAGPLKPVLAGLLRRKPSSRMKPDEVRKRLRRVAGPLPPEGPFVPPQTTVDRLDDGHPSSRVSVGGQAPDDAADRSPDGPPAAPHAAAANEESPDRGPGRPGPTHWPASELDGPRGPAIGRPLDEVKKPTTRRRRWITTVAVAAVVLAAGGTLAAKQFGGHGRTGSAPPGAIASHSASAPSSVASVPADSSGVPVLATVPWPCPQQRPTTTTTLPPSASTMFGMSSGTLTWFPFTNRFPVILPSWQVARSSSTACLYDFQAGPMIGLHSAPLTGSSRGAAAAALDAYRRQLATTVNGLRVASPMQNVSLAAAQSAMIEYTFNGQTGKVMRAFVRSYVVGRTVYVVTLVTFDGDPTGDRQAVFDPMVASVGRAQGALAPK